jgi:hypothetical protein
MTKHRFIASVLGSVTAALCQTTAVSGRVMDESGVPVANAAIVWVARTAPPVGVPLASEPARKPLPGVISRGSQISGQHGQFQIPNASFGSYTVCVTSLAQHSYLSTCEWRAYETVLSISDRHRETLNLVVPTGCVLRFHVTDSKARLTTGNLSIIASAPNHGFAHARVVTLTPTQAELVVAVPFNTTIALIVNAPFSISESSGAPLTLCVPSTTIVVASQASLDVTLTVE